MPNILINPNTGIIEFNTGIAGGAVFDTNLSGLRMTYDNFGAINLLSYNTNVSSGLDRFTIDGSNGRLFSVTDNLVGSLFSVNDIAGLPIIEAFDDNTVIMGAFNRNDFIITGGCVGIGTLPNTGFTKLLVNGTGVFGTSNTNYTRLTSNPLSVMGSGNTFVQLNIQNLAIGDAASSDLVLTSNAGTDDSFYLDLGINNSGYNQAAYNIGSSGDGYLYVHGGNLTIGTQSPNRTIKFHTDGTTSTNQIAEINFSGYFSPNKSVIAQSGIFGINNRVLSVAGAFIGGGSDNSIERFTTCTPFNSSIVGGGGNSICSVSASSFIGGGTGNSILRSSYGVIGGGVRNCIVVPLGGIGNDYNFIGGGGRNTISGFGCNNIILNGLFNCNIANFGSTIINGCCNCVGGSFSLINGCGNFTNGIYSSVHGLRNTGINDYTHTFGALNRNESCVSSILGGAFNKTFGTFISEYNIIVGGSSNCIGACANLGREFYSKNSFIGGGIFNSISGNIAGSECSQTIIASTIVGGANNTICSDYSAILGGRCNNVGHHGSTVIGDGASRIKRSVGACTLALDFCCGISLANNTLFDATPQILRVNSNFNITTGYNSRMILVNSAAAPVTGFLTSGQVNGFNASLVQIGAGQIQIAPSGAGITLNSYNSQYKSAGIYSAISVLHTGNNGYIMYGNATS